MQIQYINELLDLPELTISQILKPVEAAWSNSVGFPSAFGFLHPAFQQVDLASDVERSVYYLVRLLA